MLQKYGDHESAVDCFVQLLLYRLGYYSKWLNVFPQLRLKLIYGGGIVKDAIPDFTVVDVVSFLRMAVMEDKKRYSDSFANSEPQLIAELIALSQANAADEAVQKRLPQQPVIGVCVCGMRFWFYCIDNPDCLLSAMATNTAAIQSTLVRKLGEDRNGLEFLVLEERKIIIKTLDTIANSFRKQGLTAERRQSHASAESLKAVL